MKVDYSKTFIYKLCCNDINIKDIYVGHSTDFKSRNQDHKTCCNNVNSKKYNAYKYQFIREHGGYENWKMIKLYDFPCNSKREAEAEEDKTMQELGATLNKIRAFTTAEEKKEQSKKSSKEWRENNSEYKKEYDEKYYQNNKEELSQKHKQYYENHKNEKKEYDKEYYEKRKNDPKYIKWQKEYYENNRDIINQKAKQNKVICQFCNCEMRADSLKRHQKTISCLKFQECMIIDDE